ncbi:MAG: 2-oxo acid dehydrogenase subunit E2 [Elusimicrobiota bacterium]|jgi:pyruvate/2-oxoglutarate dehydrogenase complex dihydrolipoamide acyltransferase (E2) component
MANDPLLVPVPKENVNDETVRLAAWKSGDRSKVSAGDVVAELETSKAIIEVLSPAAGFLRHAASEGSVLPVGGPLCWITEAADAPLPLSQAGPQACPSSPSASGSRFSKAAMDLISKHRLDKAAFSGKGMVRESDVLAHLGKRGKTAVEASAAHLKGLSVTREDLPGRKLAEIASLSQGQNAGLSSLVCLPCPLEGYTKSLSRHPEISATPLALIVSAAGRLLKAHPALNAFYEDGTLCLYDSAHVGFVIDADRGLAVPVVRDADKKDLKAVARDMQDLMLSYEEGELSVEAVSNGTFTVTDLSAEGVVFFHPLINQRQAAILGIAAPRGDAFDLILSFDHRVTEGRAAARFLRDLRDRLIAA